MSAVRMHSPPARTVKRPNQRWARQRPITRGGVSDHEEEEIVATGATAGTPGAFTPEGAVAPANLAAMTGIVANPNTAWTIGEHVVLGDASHAYWDGAAWAAGEAP
ncbi:MAG TPA: hypothetical protein VFX15_00280 [Actinomycetes bacterium]|nr:hypothetical protein [Actinomycetes bacterium]